MKKTLFIIFCSILLITYLQFGRDYRIISNVKTGSKNYEAIYLNVISNKLCLSKNNAKEIGDKIVINYLNEGSDKVSLHIYKTQRDFDKNESYYHVIYEGENLTFVKIDYIVI